MRIDRQSRKTAKRLFRVCLKADGTIDEARMRDVAQRIAQEKPRGCLAILSRIQQLLELSIEERSVRVESATPLPDNGDSIFAELEQRYGPSSRRTYEVNPELIGGLRVRRGSNIWDGSVQNRLARLEQILS